MFYCANDTISKLDRVRFLIFGLVLCHVTLSLAETSVVNSRPSVLHGANLIWFDSVVWMLRAVANAVLPGK